MRCAQRIICHITTLSQTWMLWFRKPHYPLPLLKTHSGRLLSVLTPLSYFAYEVEIDFLCLLVIHIFPKNQFSPGPCPKFPDGVILEWSGTCTWVCAHTLCLHADLKQLRKTGVAMGEQARRRKKMKGFPGSFCQISSATLSFTPRAR